MVIKGCRPKSGQQFCAHRAKTNALPHHPPLLARRCRAAKLCVRAIAEHRSLLCAGHGYEFQTIRKVKVAKPGNLSIKEACAHMHTHAHIVERDAEIIKKEVRERDAGQRSSMHAPVQNTECYFEPCTVMNFKLCAK